MISAAKPSLSVATLSAPSDLTVAKQLAASLVALHPALGNPSSDFATEVGVAAGDISNMFNARFGTRDPSAQQQAFADLMNQLVAIHDKLDSLSDMNQSAMLDLQRAMERLARLTVTLSKVLQASSDAQQTITSSLK